MRSLGANNPKEAGQQYVALYTAESGPEGAPLRQKYLQHAVKGTKTKSSGNSGNTGRAYRRYQRGHGGGQVPNEEKARRAEQSRLASQARTNWW